MESVKGGAEQPNTTIPESSEITAQQPGSLAKSVVSFFRKQYQTFSDALKDFDKVLEKVCQVMEYPQSKTNCDRFFQEIYDAVNKTVKERGRALNESEKEELAELKELHKLVRESESKQLKYLMSEHRWVRSHGWKKKLVARCPPYHLYYLNLYNHARELEDLLNKNKTQTKK